ncbi:hypothetical protein F5Y17DRAFT_12558 [Xylariaceae sp. FL0594]|nr:hypothetical protein F5Y17DRAFT_12558 [Xylariaceae sp. FL0594]
MQLNNNLLVLIISFMCGSLAWDHSSEHEFRRAISGHGQALVAFAEPSSIASQALEAEWTSLGTSLHGAALLSIDCSIEATLCSESEVISYPALRYYDGHGHTRSYRGPRRASAIAAFLKRVPRPVITELGDSKGATEALVAFPSVDETVLIAYLLKYQSQQGEHRHFIDSFKALASKYRDRATFGLVSGPEGSANDSESSTRNNGTVAEDVDEDVDVTVTCYNNQDEQRFTMSGVPTAFDALENLFKTCREPLIGEFTRVTEKRYLQTGKSLVFFFATSPRETEAFVEEMRPLAKMYREYLSFVTVTVTLDAEADGYVGLLLAQLGLVPGGDFPALSVHNPMNDQVFPFDADTDSDLGLDKDFARDEKRKITPETVGAFLTDIVQGRVKPWDGKAREKEERSRSHDEL